MNRNYINGRMREYQAIKELESNGEIVIRAAGSHGPFDIISFNLLRIRFISIKSIKDKTKYYSLVNSETNKLLQYKELVPQNSRIELWIYVKGQKVNKIHIAP
jgi:Holliday junction resolvase